MPFNDALLTIGAAAMQTAAAYASIHTDAADTSANESTAGREAITWETAANGDMVMLVDVPFTGGEAAGPALRIGLWSAASGGTYYGSFELQGDTSFNAAGEYVFTGLSVLGSSTDTAP